MSARIQLKKSFYSLVNGCGVNWYLRRKSRTRLLVLNYHGVVAEEHVGDDLAESADSFLHRNAISRARFCEQMEVTRKQFHHVSAGDVLDWIAGRGGLPDSPVLITFDDGFRNNATIAAPELQRLGIPAVFHLAAGYIGTDRILWPLELDQLILGWPQETFPLPDCAEEIELPKSPAQLCDLCDNARKLCKKLADSARRDYLDMLRSRHTLTLHDVDAELNEFMTWDDARTLSRNGFAIGSHTMEHPILTKLDADELCRELSESKQTIERELGTECPILAYPNGGPEDFSPAVVDAARDAGYQLAFTLLRGFNGRDTPPFEFQRVNIPSELSLAEFQAMASGLYTYLRGSA